MHQIALLSSRVRVCRLMSQRQFSADVGIALDQGDGKDFTEGFLKRPAINPKPLVVVALSHWESHQRQPATSRQSCVGGGVIKGGLRMTIVMFGTALEERFTQHSQRRRR